MSIADQTRIKELEQRVKTLEEQQKQQEERVTDMEKKYHMLNARMARGKTE